MKTKKPNFTERYCNICNRKLGIYNSGKVCFSHGVKDKEQGTGFNPICSSGVSGLAAMAMDKQYYGGYHV